MAFNENWNVIEHYAVSVITQSVLISIRPIARIAEIHADRTVRSVFSNTKFDLRTV